MRPRQCANWLRRGAIVALLATLVVGLGESGYGQRASIRRTIETKQDEVNAAKKAEERARAQLQRVERELARTRAQKDATRQKWTLAKKKEAEAKKGYEAAVAKYNKQKEAFQERIVELYMEGETTYLEVLLEAKDFYDLVNRAYLCQKLVEADAGLFKAIKAQKERLAKAEREWKNKAEEAQAREAKLREQEAVLGVVEKRQRDVSARAKSARQRAERDLAALREESRRIEQMLRLIGGTSTVPKWSGKYLVPVRGRLSSGFGMRFHPILKEWKMHTGVDISARTGTPIAASAGGVVVFSGWRRGYGNTVMIDHGGRISTLYAHCSRLLVRVGQQVKQGQTIATVGSTGLSTGPHVHWEKRLYGKPVNPL